MEIYLIRHTTPDIAQGVCYGQTDLDVVSTFQNEYERIVPHVDSERFEKIYSSPLQRCAKLAQKFSDDIVYDDRLKEMSFGDWEMKKWEEIEQPNLKDWMQDFVGQPPPNGESFDMLRNRVMSYWNELIENDEEKVKAVFTHGGVIRTIVCELLEIPLSKAFQFHLDYGCVTKIAANKWGMRVEYLNR